jgi:hypothetical protein
MKVLLMFLMVFLFLFASVGCKKDSPTVFDSPAEVIKSNEKIFIVDRTGKKWDVTHAVDRYGFKADQFQFGLGPKAIPPLQNPQFLKPGDPGYPASFDQTLIIGTRLKNDARAYPIFMMKTYEIVDEEFDSTFVAVAY